MKINLDQFFKPKSVAVIGASRKIESAGHGVLKSLLEGGVFESDTNKPFTGKIYPINPKAEELMGLKCYSSILDVKDDVDLAIISVNAKFVKQVVEECCQKKVKGGVIISAGFSELGKEGKELQAQIVEIAREGGMRLIGPNCLGIMRPSANLNASFGLCQAPRGKVAFFSQSGALVDSVIDWSLEANYGFSSIISIGNQADLDVADFIEWAIQDKETASIAVYLEGIKDGKKFMRICREATKKKPVIVLKSGRSAEGSKAVSSHTGSLAGSYQIFKTAFKQSGVIVAEDFEELFDLALTFANLPSAKDNAIAIVTNGGGAGVLCLDSCETYGVDLVRFSEKVLKELDSSNKMHPAYSRRNPLDIVGDALPERYKAALEIVMKQKEVHGAIVIQTLQSVTDPKENANAIVSVKKMYPDKPIVCCFMGGRFTRPGIEVLERNGIPNFSIPMKAARAMGELVKRGIFLKK